MSRKVHIAAVQPLAAGPTTTHEMMVQSGLTLYSLGRATDAIRSWTQVLANEPTREDAQMYLRLVRTRKPVPPAASPRGA